MILASNGYPTSYKKGFEITMTAEAAAHTYVAGAKLENGKLVTSGGRVTGTTAVADTLEDAIRQCRALASEGWNVLLSPACASFDMFSDYEARGRIFKELVNKLN